MKKIHVSAILILLVVMSSCAGLIINFKNSQLMSIQKGMTQQELADLVNVRRETIVRLENGRRFLESPITDALMEQWKSGNIAGIFPKQGIR